MSGSPPAAAEQRPASHLLGAAALPLELDEFDRRVSALGPFEQPPRLAVAVSGGADSTALALLARDWATARGGSVRAFLVDHGLRPDSAAEAARALGRLAALWIPARLLLWRGPAPSRRVQERARAARLALLEAACAEAGILHLLLAHHAEDQRETVAMRAARRSGPEGLAGMPALRETARVRLLRPLLDVPKARLIATLRARGIAWEEDPSNRDPRFERARLRRAATALPSLAAIAAAGRRRAEREEAMAALAARIVRPDPRHRRLLIEAAPLFSAKPELAHLVLRRALHAVGGGPYPPAPAAVARLLAGLGAAPDGARRSLGRCLVTRRGAVVAIAPEPARQRRAPEANEPPPLAGAAFLPMLLE